MSVTKSDMKYEQPLFYIKNSLFRVQVAFNFIDKNVDKNDWIRALFVSDDFVARLKNYARHIPLSCEESAVVHKMFGKKKLDNVLVISQSDFPELKLWNVCHEFMATVISGYHTGPSLYGTVGYASRGKDLMELHFMCNQETGVVLDGDCVISHDCSAISDNEMHDSEYLDALHKGWAKFDIIKMNIGEVSVCSGCGEHRFMDILNTSQLYDMYRTYIDSKV